MIPNNSSRAHTKHQLKTYFLGAYHSSVKCTYCYIVMTVAQSKCCTLLYVMAIYFVILHWCPHLSVLCYQYNFYCPDLI